MFSIESVLNEQYPDSPFFTAFKLLNDEEIETFKGMVRNFNTIKALTTGEEKKPSFIVYDGEEKDEEKYRNSKISWVQYDQTNIKLKNLYKKLFKLIVDVNSKIYNYKITDVESFQFTIYDEGDYYKQHIDCNFNKESVGNLQRKISFSIQLSDETDYDGGELKFYFGKDDLVAPKNKGSMTFFPSYILHEVTPVTRGRRLALVGWVWGPRFE